MFFLCAGAAGPSQAKAKATAKAKSKVKAKASATITPKSTNNATPSTNQRAKILNIINKGKPKATAQANEDAHDDRQETTVMLGNKEIVISRKDRRDHHAMLQTSQAIN